MKAKCGLSVGGAVRKIKLYRECYENSYCKETTQGIGLKHKGNKMGWSCCRRAAWVMDAWKDACIAQKGTQNTFQVGEKKYFWEIGRENHDGAITGTIWKFLPDGVHVRRSGTFRIEGDGEVSPRP